MQYFGGEGKEVTLTVGIIPAILLFIVGVIASATMVIPGVSGSMMLMILGYYNPILLAVKDFTSALAKGQWHTILQLCGSLIPFGLGVVIGIFAIAKMIEVLLNKQETLTYTAILGLVAASPVVILMQTPLLGLSAVTWIYGVIILAVGFVFAIKLSV